MAHAQQSKQYKEYRLLNVYRNISAELREKIVSLWQRNHVLPAGADPYQRVDEVAVLVLNPDNEVVGVSTVYIEFRPILKEDAFMFRMFIQPQDRIAGMMTAVVKTTYALLNDYQMDNKPKSLMNINENPKLSRPGIRRQFERVGYQYLGQDQRGCDIWRWAFSNN